MKPLTRGRHAEYPPRCMGYGGLSGRGRGREVRTVAVGRSALYRTKAGGITRASLHLIHSVNKLALSNRGVN